MTEEEWIASNNPVAMLDWLTAKHVHRDVFVRSFVNDRKLRLFACACWWEFDKRGIPDGVLGYALKSAERWADTGRKPPPTVMRGNIEDYIFGYGDPSSASRETLFALPDRREFQADLLRDIFGNPFRPVAMPEHRVCDRCSGNIAHVGSKLDPPYCAQCYDKPERGLLKLVESESHPWLQWNNGTIPKLAQAIYEERAWDRMPILGDALEEAGCTDTTILEHCRREHSSGPCDGTGTNRGYCVGGLCPQCGGSGQVRRPVIHTRGCWLIDLLTGKA